jgi:hypothetical protein
MAGHPRFARHRDAALLRHGAEQLLRILAVELDRGRRRLRQSGLLQQQRQPRTVTAVGFLAMGPQVITHDIRRKVGGEPERGFQSDPAFRPIGNWYHNDFHAQSSVQAPHRGSRTGAEFHYINRNGASPGESED